jgi:hypothetical protein
MFDQELSVDPCRAAVSAASAATLSKEFAREWLLPRRAGAAGETTSCCVCVVQHELLMLLWMQMAMVSCCVCGDEHGELVMLLPV